MKTYMILIYVSFNVLGFVEPQNSQSPPQCVQRLFASDSTATYGFSTSCYSKYSGFFTELTWLPQRIMQEEMQNYGSDPNITAKIVLRTVRETMKLYCSENGRQALQCQADYLNRECPELQAYLASLNSQVYNLLSTGSESSSFKMILDSVKGVDFACAGVSGSSGGSGRNGDSGSNGGSASNGGSGSSGSNGGSGSSGGSGGNGVEPRAKVNISVIILLAVTVFSIVYQY